MSPMLEIELHLDVEQHKREFAAALESAKDRLLPGWRDGPSIARQLEAYFSGYGLHGLQAQMASNARDPYIGGLGSGCWGGYANSAFNSFYGLRSAA